MHDTLAFTCCDRMGEKKEDGEKNGIQFENSQIRVVRRRQVVINDDSLSLILSFQLQSENDKKNSVQMAGLCCYFRLILSEML